jgi:hypothetical protein
MQVLDIQTTRKMEHGHNARLQIAALDPSLKASATALSARLLFALTLFAPSLSQFFPRLPIVPLFF